MKSTKVTIGVLASCNDCDWNSQDYRKAEEQGKYHAYSRKHRVWMEVTKLVEIDGTLYK